MILVLRRRVVSRLQRWAHRIVCRRRVRRALRDRRQRLEAQAAGLAVHSATQQRWYAHFLWMGAKKTKNYEAPHELQKIFSSYSVNGGMDPGRMGKFAKDCGMMADDLSVQVLELQFTKVKLPQEKRIDYARFIDLLLSLAMIKIMKLPPGKLPSVGSATVAPPATVVTSSPAGKSTVGKIASPAGKLAVLGSVQQSIDKDDDDDDNNASELTLEEQVYAFKFAGLKGKPALVAALVFKYTVPNLKDFAEVSDFLNQKSARSIAATHVSRGVESLQNFFRNRLFVKKLTTELAATKKRKLDAFIFDSANRIQRCIRGFLGRRQIIRIAQRVYTKFLDGETDREYWCNSRSGSSFWTKPALLGKFDCGIATRTPKADEIFQVQCSSCNNVTATW